MTVNQFWGWLALLLFVWIAGALWQLRDLWREDRPRWLRPSEWGKWLSERENWPSFVFWGFIICVNIVTWVAWLLDDTGKSELANWREFATSVAFTVFGVDRFNRRRSYLEQKKEILVRLRSASHDVVLDAIVRARLLGMFQDGSLRDQWFFNVQWQGADLQGADLQGVKLGGANLQGANLDGANLDGANLSFARMQRAFLRDAMLNGTILQDTNLEEACLWGADLRGADLDKAKLHKALYSRRTRWPKYFDIHASGAELLPEPSEIIDNIIASIST